MARHDRLSSGVSQDVGITILSEDRNDNWVDHIFYQITSDGKAIEALYGSDDNLYTIKKSTPAKRCGKKKKFNLEKRFAKAMKKKAKMAKNAEKTRRSLAAIKRRQAMGGPTLQDIVNTIKQPVPVYNSPSSNSSYSSDSAKERSTSYSSTSKKTVTKNSYESPKAKKTDYNQRSADANHCVSWETNRVKNKCSKDIWVKWYAIGVSSGETGSQCRNGCALNNVRAYGEETSIGTHKYRKDFAACFLPNRPQEYKKGNPNFYCAKRQDY